MLLVKAGARPSSIHGLGLFAGQDIPAGTPVARWSRDVDYRMMTTGWYALPPRLRDFLYDYVWDGPDGMVYGTADAGRFTNHSNSPNLRWDEQVKTSFAVRDIVEGEELTENYGEFDASFETYEGTLR